MEKVQTGNEHSKDQPAVMRQVGPRSSSSLVHVSCSNADDDRKGSKRMTGDVTDAFGSVVHVEG